MTSKKTSVRKPIAPPADNKETKRGYNEKNPTQPQGAFKPDANSSPKKAPKKSAGNQTS